MAVLEHRKGRSAVQELVATPRRVVLEAVHSFKHIPAVIFSSGACCRLEVDFFPGVLTHIGDEKITRLAVEGETPGIAHAVCPDLVQCVRVAHEWVIRWHGVVAIRVAGETIAVNVHTQDLAQPGLEILSVLLRVAAAAAVAQSDVQVAIRAKGDLPAVVVGKRLRLSQDRVSRIGIADVWILRRNCVASHHGVARVVRVIDVEEAVIGVVGVESQAEQALLAATAHQVGDIQERGGQDCAVNQD